MEEKHHYAIRKNRPQLVRELDIESEVLDYLHSEQTFTKPDLERIKSYNTESKRNREFLDILVRKGPKAYEKFLTALHDSAQYHLHRAVESQAAKWSEEIACTELKEWLQVEYEVKRDGYCLVEHIIEYAAIHQITAPILRLKEAISQTFPKAVVEEGSTGLFVKILHIQCKTDVSQEELPAAVQELQEMDINEDSDASEEDLDEEHSCMNDWDVELVGRWLDNVLPDSRVAKNIFEEQQITGEILQTLQRSDYASGAFSGLPFGTFCKILLETEKEKESEKNGTDNGKRLMKPKKIIQKYCPFATKEIFRYQLGATLPLPKKRPGIDLMLPFHFFVDVSDSEKKHFVTTDKLIQFTCACLNDRTNGTLHVGISPTGVIIGAKLDVEKLEQLIHLGLEKCFPPDLGDIVKYCLGEIRKVPVEGAGDDLCVFEIDVVPNSHICKDKIFYARRPSIKKKVQDIEPFQVYRIINAFPGHLDPEAMVDFSNIVSELYHIRENAERRITKSVDKSFLKDRLVDLLCLGDDRMAVDAYPILFLSCPNQNMDREFMQENLSFIKDMPWKAVLDFDSEARICTYMQEVEDQNMRVLTTEAFDSKQDVTLKKCTALHEEMKNSSQLPWIFADGYTPGDYEVSENAHGWFKDRGQKGFRETVQFLHSVIPEHRAIVVFLVLSDEGGDKYTKGACEICSYFSEQYVILSDLEQISNAIQEELVHGSYTKDMSMAKERSVVGIPWRDVNAVIKELVGSVTSDIFIPSSTGMCVVKPKVKNEWTDLEILGSNECDRETHITENNETRNQFRIEVQERFYRGSEVDWWNFYFKNQVMPREIHNDLKRMVEKALDGTLPEMDDDVIGRVTLYHQPGAGATTTAKHILWDLRKKYRCAIASDISEITADHISELYLYGDDPERAKSVLILLDNIDEDKEVNLITSVEMKQKEMAHFLNRQITRKIASDISVVFLVCRRALEKPQHCLRSRSMILKQELKPNERDWMRAMHEQLEKTFQENQGTDPRYLISFNVLRQGFNIRQIKKTAAKLVEDIKSEREKLMLKYLAFLNMFDLHHRQVPVAVFDNLMYKDILLRPKTAQRSRGRGYGHLVSVPGRWELQISHCTKILLNESHHTSFGKVKTVGIIHPALSEALLTILAKNGDTKQTVGDVATEFLNCQPIFNQTNCAKVVLLKLLKDILIQRSRDPEGKPKKQFAALIEELRTKESPEMALEIFETGYNLTEDPFVSQQIARFYIQMQNWDKADKFARKATEQKPENSYLWDTHAQVYREKLFQQYNTLMEENQPITPEEGIKIVITAHQAMNLFRKEQSFSEEETGYPTTNDAGFFGEIKTFLKLMDCLVYVDVFITENPHSSKETLRKFIVSPRYVPAPLLPWANVDGVDYILILKNMWRAVVQTLNRLEDENVQLRESFTDDHILSLRAKRIKDIDMIKRKFDSYFGEYTDEIPENLTPEEQCNFYRRRVKTVAGVSLGDFFSLAGTEEGEQKLLQMLGYLKKNIASDNATADDYNMAITAVFALLKFDVKHVYTIPPGQVVEWSRRLYELREKLDIIALEPYLFYTMLNWPRKNTKLCVNPTILNDALKQWRLTYWKKYPRQREERKYKKKETVMFFFANGSDLASLANYEEMRNYEMDVKNSQFWRQPYVLRKLQRFHGTLNGDGDQVSVPVVFDGNTHRITIPTSLPKRDPRMLNKKVYFVIGFSWAGPKAYDVDLKDPTEDVAAVAEGHTVPKPKYLMSSLPGHAWYHHEQHHPRLSHDQWEFRERLQKIRDEIQSLHALKETRRLSNTEERKYRRLKRQERDLLKERKEPSLLD